MREKKKLRRNERTRFLLRNSRQVCTFWIRWKRVAPRSRGWNTETSTGHSGTLFILSTNSDLNSAPWLEGNPKLTLGLIWTIILHYQVRQRSLMYILLYIGVQFLRPDYSSRSFKRPMWRRLAITTICTVIWVIMISLQLIPCFSVYV